MEGAFSVDMRGATLCAAPDAEPAYRVDSIPDVVDSLDTVVDPGACLDSDVVANRYVVANSGIIADLDTAADLGALLDGGAVTDLDVITNADKPVD